MSTIHSNGYHEEEKTQHDCDKTEILWNFSIRPHFNFLNMVFDGTLHLFLIKVLNEVLAYLDLSLDILNGIRCLHLQGDGLPRQSLDKDLHASPQPQHQVESGLLLDVVI